MQTSIEAQRLFLRELGRQAPQIIHDLFIRGNAQEWAAGWGILSEWVIYRADSALNLRRGNLAQIRRMRERGNLSDEILRAWEVEDLRAWEEATRSLIPTPPLEIAVFDDDEDFRYLTLAELADRVKKRLEAAVIAYHKAVFEDNPYFGLYRQLPKTRAGQDEKHMRWLIEYISGKSDPEIAAGEQGHGARSPRSDIAEAVRKGRSAFARMIELKIADRRGKGNRTRRR